MKPKDNYKVLPLAIIGGGPAGVTAAIYAKRSNVSPIIFTNEVIGGKAAKTLIIENYPGINSMTGPEFCQKLEDQIKYLNIKVILKKIITIDTMTNGVFVLNTENEKYYFEKVIIATGTRERKHPAKNSEKLEGKGISYCSSCDGYFFKDQIIGVIGGGNSAIEESKILAQIGKKVIILNRENKFNAEPFLMDEINKLKNVELKYNTNIIEFIGIDQLEAIKIENLKNKTTEIIKMDGIFIFIGSIPNNSFIKDEWKIKNENGYILVNKNFETKINNLYAIGDIAEGLFQQYTTAVGSATIAFKDIIDKGYKIAVLK